MSASLVIEAQRREADAAYAQAAAQRQQALQLAVRIQAAADGSERQRLEQELQQTLTALAAQERAYYKTADLQAGRKTADRLAVASRIEASRQRALGIQPALGVEVEDVQKAYDEARATATKAITERNAEIAKLKAEVARLRAQSQARPETAGGDDAGRIAELEQEVEKLNAINSTAQRGWQTDRDAKERLEQEVSVKNAEIANLKDELKNATSGADTALKSRIEFLETQWDSAATARDEAVSRVTALTKKLESVTAARDEALANLIKCREEIQAVVIDRDELEEENDRLRAELEQARTQATSSPPPSSTPPSIIKPEPASAPRAGTPPSTKSVPQKRIPDTFDYSAAFWRLVRILGMDTTPNDSEPTWPQRATGKTYKPADLNKVYKKDPSVNPSGAVPLTGIAVWMQDLYNRGSTKTIESSILLKDAVHLMNLMVNDNYQYDALKTEFGWGGFGGQSLAESTYMLDPLTNNTWRKLKNQPWSETNYMYNFPKPAAKLRNAFWRELGYRLVGKSSDAFEKDAVDVYESLRKTYPDSVEITRAWARRDGASLLSQVLGDADAKEMKSKFQNIKKDPSYRLIEPPDLASSIHSGPEDLWESFDDKPASTSSSVVNRDLLWPDF